MSENIIIIAAVAYLVYGYMNRNNIANASANNTQPYWYTLSGFKPKMFDYASQSNYMAEALNNG